jgi:transposase
VQNATLWRALLGVEKTVIEDIEFDEDEQLLVAHVRARKRARGQCGRCGRRSPAYDRGEGRRRWRALDLGTIQAVLEAEAPRVRCREHGPTVAAVPWARHAAGHTHAFDEQVAWLATQCSKTAITELMRIAWRTVGAIITRVWADVEAVHDRFAGLRRIGIDEISYKRGHKFLTVVVDHDTGRLVWVAPGRDRATLALFFDALGAERCAAITHVSADGADWIEDVVTQHCPSAVRCADPFHIVRWATDALDAVRREAWNTARRTPGGTTGRGRSHGRPQRVATGHAKSLKRARWALCMNP